MVAPPKTRKPKSKQDARTNLTVKPFDHAKQTSGDPTPRFVLLRTARDLAVGHSARARSVA